MLLPLKKQLLVLGVHRALNEFLKQLISVELEKHTSENLIKLTVIVNLLYMKSLGMRLKKLSLYSPQ